MITYLSPFLLQSSRNMINNDVLRRLRYIFDLSDQRMMSIFADAGWEASRAEISDWLKKDNDPAFQECAAREYAAELPSPEQCAEERLGMSFPPQKLKPSSN